MKKWEILLNIIFEIVIFLVSSILAIILIPKLLGFFWPFVAGAILAMLAAPLCAFLEKHIKLNKKWSSAFILIFVLFALALGGYLGIIKLGKEVLTLLSESPNYYKDFLKLVDSLKEFVNHRVSVLSPQVGQNIDKMLNDMLKQAGSLLNDMAPQGVEVLGSVASNVTNGLIGFFMMILSAYFFIVDREKIFENFKKWVPENLLTGIREMKNHLMGAMGGFIKAQFKIMGIIFVILLVGLFIMGSPYAMLFALLIAFLDLLPVFGTGTVLIPWGVISLLEGNIKQMIFLLILYVVCLLARQMLQPKIIGDSVGLDTLPTLVLIYAGYKISGMKGMILALLIGVVFISLYRLGVFDRKLERLRKLISDYIEYEEKI